MKSRVPRLLPGLLILALFVVPGRAQDDAPDQRWVAAGLVAKVAGTSILVAGHSMEWVRANDLAIEAPWEQACFPHTTIEVDREAGTVTARLGGVERVALLREGYGCTLVDGLTLEELRARTAKLPPRPARDTTDLPWPAGDRLSEDPLPEGVDLEALDEVLDEAFAERPGRP